MTLSGTGNCDVFEWRGIVETTKAEVVLVSHRDC